MKFGKQSIHDIPTNDLTSLAAYAQQMQQEAKTRGHVLPPPVRLHIGEPSFRTPEHICRAAIQSLENETQTYAPPAGWPWLRELLAAKIERVDGYSVKPWHTAIAMGGTGAVLAALLATVDVGDEVLISDPAWPFYSMQLTTCGVIGVPYPLDPHGDWLPDMAHLEKLVTPRTRVLIINSPGNPTGSVYPLQVISDLLDFARRHDLYLLSDECYDQLLFEGQHISPATLLSPDEFEEGRFIGVYSFSKTYAMTGWRIGYVVAGTKLIETITNALKTCATSVSTLIQRGAAAALTGPQDCVTDMCDAYRRRRDLAVALLKDHGRYIYTPHGAFYALVDVSSRKGGSRKGHQFALDLLHERNVAVVQGSAFGSVTQEYVRISLAAPEEEIAQGIREICLFADR